MSIQRVIVNDAITQYLVDLFNSVSEEMRPLWAEFDKGDDGKGKEIKVYRDLQEQLPYVPSIEIVAKGKDNEIFAIATQHDTFNYNIIISSSNNSPEYSSTYNRIIATAYFDLLNDLNRRAFTVPKYNFCVYYSEARNLDYGFRRGKGLRASQFTWTAKLLKPGRI